MNIIEWTDELAVGIETIDRDHQRLIDHINRYIETLTKPLPKSVRIRIFHELKTETLNHFQNETKYFEQCDNITHEHLNVLLQRQRLYKQKLIQFQHIVEESDELEKLFDIAEFIAKWTIEHIIEQNHTLLECREYRRHSSKRLVDVINRRISLHEKIRLLVLFPIVLLLFFSLILSYDYFQRYRQLTLIQKTSISVLRINEVINALQIERDLSSAYLTSTNNMFKTKLYHQRQQTDMSIQEGLKHRPVIERFTSTKPAFSLYRLLPSKRRQIDHKTLQRYESNRYYTRFIHSLIDLIRTLEHLGMHGIPSYQYASILLLIQINENLGLIRNEGFSLIQSASNDMSTIRHLDEKRRFLDSLFRNVAAPSIIERYNRMRQTPIAKRFETIMHSISINGTLPKIDGNRWFILSSNYIDLYKKLVESTLQKLYIQSLENQKSTRNTLLILWILMVLFLLLLIWIGFSLQKSIIQPIEALTDALQTLTKGNKRYSVFYHQTDKFFQKVYRAYHQLRLSLIKADYSSVMHKIQTMRAKKFEEISRIDPLTGVANRRALELFFGYKKIPTDLIEPITMLIIDLDHFKLINDTYGHDVGDKVLRRFAKILTTHMRQEDFIARFGGEEFVVVMSNTPLKNGIEAAKKLQRFVQNIDFSDIAADLRLTVSIGVASSEEIKANRSSLLPTLFKIADKRLYIAKKKGRNRIVA